MTEQIKKFKHLNMFFWSRALYEIQYFCFCVWNPGRENMLYTAKCLCILTCISVYLSAAPILKNTDATGKTKKSIL